MKLLTKEIKKRMPYLGDTDGKWGDAVAQLKLFTPWANLTWYATEGCGLLENGMHTTMANPDAVDYLFFGLVDGHKKELGYFRLGELTEVTGPAGLKIERDKWFDPTPLKEIEPDKFK